MSTTPTERPNALLPEQEVRRLRIILPILDRMHPATIRWLFQRLGADR